MRIDPPADDYGLQRLRHDNAASGTVPNLQRTAPYPRIAPSEQRRERYAPVERRGERDRRGGERRRQDEPVLTDTREPHERRHNLRRRADRDRAKREALADETPTRGIDVCA